MALRVAVLAMASAAGFLALLTTPAAAQSPGPNGATLFKQRCSICHAPGKSVMGPDLAGVMTRSARPTYAYSPAMLKQPVKWDAKRLDTFLAAPQKAVPGSKMMVGVASPADRTLLVAHLKTLK